MKTSEIGFAVVYRWRVRSDTEIEFQRAWEAVTRSLMRERGAMGSRLHRAEDGSWVAYAQWPDEKAWKRSREQEAVDPDAAAVMGQAIEESFQPILLSPVCDYLVHAPIRGDGAGESGA